MSAETINGWSVKISSGFHRTSAAGLLKENQNGWPVLQGRNFHQFNHRFAKPEFTASKSAGLEREKRRHMYNGYSREFYHSFRLAFRNIARPTSLRTIITSIIPPRVFHTHSVSSIVLMHNGRFEQGNDYNRRIAYLCGVMNSTAYDFVARSKAQLNTPSIIKTTPLPNEQHYNKIAELAARLCVGTAEFAGFAESLRVDNIPLRPPKRIRTAARLDALVAHAYGLTADEYQTVLDSFKLFKENPALLEAESADFNDNKTLGQFYGEMRKLAPHYYAEIARSAT